MLLMKVRGIMLDKQGNPVVILKDPTGSRVLPIWIGPTEAISIASALERLNPPRPLTHDLFVSFLKLLGDNIENVVIHDFKDSTYFATINFKVYLEDELQNRFFDARPSDAIALALRLDSPIYLSDDLINHLIPLESPTREIGPGPETSEAKPDKTADEWKKVVDRLKPSDFEP